MFAEIDSDISALDTRGKKHSIWKYRSIGYVAPMFLEIKKNHQMSEQPVFSTNCRARNGQSDCSNARSKKLTQQSKVIKKALNYKV